MKKEFVYEIGGTKYFQKPLVLGQILQLGGIVEGLAFASGSALAIITALGPKISEAIAVALHEDGKKLQDKDVQELASELQFKLSPEQTIEVIEDFFECNPIASLLDKLTGMTEKIKMQMNKAIGLKKSSASSQKETLQKETASSGDTQ